MEVGKALEVLAYDCTECSYWGEIPCCKDKECEDYHKTVYKALTLLAKTEKPTPKTVWCIYAEYPRARFKGKYRHQVESINSLRHLATVIDVEFSVEERKTTKTHLLRLGQTVFLTEEEAKRKIKEVANSYG